MINIEVPKCLTYFSLRDLGEGIVREENSKTNAWTKENFKDIF